MKFFLPISKVDESDDGTLTITGIASTEAIDAQGEVIKSTAIEAAIPDYMRHGTGALREMHQPLAAGAVDSAVIENGETIITARVVDPVAITKVKAGVYKGLSVGGRVTERDSVNKNTITGLKLVEISLVDRPACPEAVLTMWKSEDLDEAEIAAAEAIAKSLWDVAALADILAQLKCVQNCAAWDAAYEGDDSTAPAKLKEAVNMLAGVLIEMVGEEIKEPGDVAMADKPGDVAKGDEPLANVDPANPNAITAETPGQSGAAVAKVEETDMAKVDDMIAKAVAAAIEPLAKANTDLAAELEKIKAQPATPKGAVMAVGKGDAIEAAKADDVEPVLKADGSIDEIATDIKKVQLAGLL